MTEKHKTMLPQKDLISWKSKAAVFSTRKQEYSQRLNPAPLLRPPGEGGDIIPTDLIAAFRIILLQPLGTWEHVCICMCVCVCVCVCVCWRLKIGENGSWRIKRALVCRGRSVPLETT